MGDIDHIDQKSNNNNNNNNNNSGLCLQLLSVSAMACYPLPYFPISALSIPFRNHEPETTRGPKRLRPNPGPAPGPPDSLRFRDHVLTYTQRFMAAEAVEEAVAAGRAEDDGPAEAGEVRLVQLLVACAEAVACRDRAHAAALLAELRARALVFGSSFQRVASCFVRGLADRLAAGPGPPFGPSSPEAEPAARAEALRLAYEVCPQIRFGHFVANRAILEAFERESHVHVIDLGMSQGLPYQWHDLLRSLAARGGDAPVERVRITAVCPDGDDDGRYRAIGSELALFAGALGASFDFEFNLVRSTLEDLREVRIATAVNEAVVVNSVLQLHRVVKESRGALNSVLRSFHELRPKALVLVEQDSSHNGPFFLGRFMEALHYYSAIFDSLDATLPKYDTRRAKIEQFYFAEEIRNIVSCEGPSRVERHERVDQWRRRMSRAGFQAAPIKMAAQARKWLGGDQCEGYTVVEEKGCLVLGWNSRPIVAVSCWKC